MAEAYKRRQLLLRREDGSPGGFIRIEQVGARCAIDVRASGIVGQARVLLLRPGEDAPRHLGTAAKGVGSFSAWAEEIEGYTQAALLRGDRPTLVGGEGAVFAEVRQRLQRARRAEREEARADARGSVEENAGTGAASPTGALPDARPDVPAPHTPPPVTAPPTTGGWTFSSSFIPGAPERITGRLVRDGRVAATLYGVAGVYAPEPPPGLDGFTWDGGYWLRVEAVGG